MATTNKKIVVTGEASGLARAMQQVEQSSRRAANSIIQDTKKAADAQDVYAKKIIDTPANKQVQSRTADLLQQGRYKEIYGIGEKRSEMLAQKNVKTKDEAAQALGMDVERFERLISRALEKGEQDKLVDAIERQTDVIQRTNRTEQREDERRHDESIESEKQRPQIQPDRKEPKESERPTTRDRIQEAGQKLADVTKNVANTAANFATAPNEYSAITSAFGIIPVVGEALAQIGGRVVEEATQLLNAQAGLRAYGAGLYGADFTRFGMNRAAANQQAQQLLQARGAGAATITGDLFQTQALQKGTGLSQAQVQRAAAAQRFTAGGTLGQQIGSLAEVLRERGVLRPGGDTTRLTELLEIQNTLIEDQSQTIEKVNQQGIARTIAAFQGVGGSFADRRAAGTIQTINAAITQPQGDFRQAFVLRELRNLMPDASLFQLKEAQEKGIFENPELFQQLFKSIKERGGTEDSVLFQLKEFFNLSFSQTRQLYDNLNKNQDFFKTLAKRETAGQFAQTGERGVARFGGTRGVSPIDVSTAAQTDRLASLGVKLINNLDGLFNKALSILEDPMKFINTALTQLKKGFNDLVEPMIKKLTDGFNQAKDGAKKLIKDGAALWDDVFNRPIQTFKKLQNNIIPGMGDFFDPLGLYK